MKRGCRRGVSTSEQARFPTPLQRRASTKDYTPLEARVLEYKLYAKGIGPVLVLGVSGGADREDLIRFTPPPS